jgi:uncharacterized protein YkwD
MTSSLPGPTLRSLFAVLVVGACVLSTATAQAQDDVAALDQMLARINQMRSALGVAVLTRAAELDAAAAVHSADMAANERLEHVSPTTGDPTTRLAAAGVRGVQIAENIALHADVMSAHAALVASEAHRTNWMNPAFTRIGLAAARSPRGVYVTQLFAAAAPAEVAAPVVASAGAALDPWNPDPVPPSAAPAPSNVAAGGLWGQAGEASVGASAGIASTVPATSTAAPTSVAPVAAAAPVAQAAPTAPVPDGTRRVAGYWVFSQQRWWYYPLPADARPGQVLQPAALPPGAAPPGYSAAGYAASGYGASGYSASTTTQWAAPPASYQAFGTATVPSTAVYVPSPPAYPPAAPRVWGARRSGRAPWGGWSPRRVPAR